MFFWLWNMFVLSCYSCLTQDRSSIFSMLSTSGELSSFSFHWKHVFVTNYSAVESCRGSTFIGNWPQIVELTFENPSAPCRKLIHAPWHLLVVRRSHRGFLLYIIFFKWNRRAQRGMFLFIILVFLFMRKLVLDLCPMIWENVLHSMFTNPSTLHLGRAVFTFLVIVHSSFPLQSVTLCNSNCIPASI